MSVGGVVILIAVVVLLGFFLRGLFQARRSVLIIVAALFVGALGGLGAWYSWMETRSLTWTAGYGTVAMIAMLLVLQQLTSSETGD